MFDGSNIWSSNYKARTELSTVEFILASHFDDVFLADLKETFENVVRTDSGNTLRTNFNFYNFRGVNLAPPQSDGDAVNKKFLNDQIYKFEAVKIEQDPVSGTYALAQNENAGVFQYSMLQGGAINFILPEPIPNILNQIMLDIKTAAAEATIDLGTTAYVSKVPVIFATNNAYTIIWEYSFQLAQWVVGAILKGASA